MKERPIPFNAAMVCAILDGRKTQTRRNVKPNEFDGKYISMRRCPYGIPGDRLWVRETWCRLFDTENKEDERTFYRATDEHLVGDIDDGDGYTVWRKDGTPASPWRPSIHMPRLLSRITLEITGIRVERLQEISEEDAKAEGLSAITKDGTLIKYGIADRDGLPGNDDHGWHWQEFERDPRNAYHKLWEQINGAGSWDANPWVWVVDFKRAEARP